MQDVAAKCRAGFAETIQRERPPKSISFKLRRFQSGVIPTAATVAGLLHQQPRDLLDEQEREQRVGGGRSEIEMLVESPQCYSINVLKRFFISSSLAGSCAPDDAEGPR